MRQTLTLKIVPHIARAAAWALSYFLLRHRTFIPPPISAGAVDFPRAGDHKAVRVKVTNALGPRPALLPVIGNVSH